MVDCAGPFTIHKQDLTSEKVNKAQLHILSIVNFATAWVE